MNRREHISKQTRLVLAVLAQQPAAWHYGYELCKRCNLKSGALYPILMRLEKGGYLITKWQASASPGRPSRRMVQLSTIGLELAADRVDDPSLPAITIPAHPSALATEGPSNAA